tara:strand:+ start:311 stop:481 length:171 start_codon:yes stop_codon:yes gene_type:complete
MRELKLVETTDGELYFDIPTDILTKYGWEDGDDIEFIDNKDGSLTLRKVETENDSE